MDTKKKTFPMKSWADYDSSSDENESIKTDEVVKIKNDSYELHKNDLQELMKNNVKPSSVRNIHYEVNDNALKSIEIMIKSAKSIPPKKNKLTHEDVCNVLRDAFRNLNCKDSLSFSAHLQNIYKQDKDLLHKLFEIDAAYRIVNDLNPRRFKSSMV